jgi:DNA-binding NarL/FixJ family response regulator
MQYYCLRNGRICRDAAGKQVNKRIKIFLSDPQVLFREGIHFILSGEDEFEVTGEATNNEDSFAYIEANPPNIAILNMRDPKVSGLEIVRRIKRRFPAISAILTIEEKDEGQLFEVIKSGASACLTKGIDPEHLLDTISTVSQGNLPIAEELLKPAIAAKMLEEFEGTNFINERMDNLMAVITEKETNLLRSIAEGNSIEQAAAKLKIDEEAVRTNLKLVLNKLVANDQTLGVISAVERGLPSMLSIGGRSKKPSEDYLTREEFERFKESLAKRLRNIVGEAI